MCLLRYVATVFVWCLAAAQESTEGTDEAVLVPIVQLLDDDTAMMGKRALNPFTDSVGKRYMHPKISINYRPPHLGVFRSAAHAKSTKNGQLETLPVDAASVNNKRQFFDALAGQTLGMRRYFDTFAKDFDKRSGSQSSQSQPSRVASLVWLPD